MLAEVADGHGKSSSSSKKAESSSFESGRMDKISFSSSISVQNPRYALGILQDKEMHLVPVKTFYQMRQTYSYFDKGDKRTKAEEKDGSEDEMEDLKQVTVKFARSGDAEKIKRARERSYQFISNIGADEKWCQAMIYPKTSAQSQMERSKIPLVHETTDVQFTSISANQYFADLISNDATLNAAVPVAHKQRTDDDNEKEDKNPITRGPISKKQIKKLPLLEQIKVFLKDGRS